MLHEPPFGYEPIDFHAPTLASPTDAALEPAPGASMAEEPTQLRRRIEDAANAANALQSALFDLEAELLRLQHIVRKASPAMMRLMQAATEVRAAGLPDH